MEELASIDVARREFHVRGRVLHDPVFRTESGRGRFLVRDIESPARDEAFPFTLTTVRSEGQFNTVVYEEEDLYRNQDRRDVILMHGDDLERLNLAEDQAVTVVSDTGRLENILARSFESIRPGNALMYYPEANALVPRRIDERSKTPAFKCVDVSIRPVQ